MAFSTSSTAFGLNQNQSNNTSIFGAPKPGNSLFGNPQQQQQPSSSTPTGFGNAPVLGQTQNQPSTGLFGSFGQNQQQNQQQQPSGGLFGQSTQQQQQPSSGLFGQPIQQQASSGGLFGQPQQQQQQPQSNLFGGSSLFGNTANQQPPQQQPTTFGGFGANVQQPQQQQTGLFGGGSSTTGGGLTAQPTLPASAFASGGGGFGTTNSLFGNKTQQPQQQQQQQSMPFGGSCQNTTPLFLKSTKFNDLPDEVKRLLENIDNHIQGRIQISKDLQQRKLGEEPTKGQDLIRNIHKDFVNISSTIRNDASFTQDMKNKVDQAVEDTIVATRIIDGFRNPQSGNTYLKDHAAFPLEFFTRVTQQMKERLDWYRSTIEQIERKLSTSTGQAQTPQGLSATLQVQHATFLALASKTAALDAELQKIKVLYTQLWRAKTGSVRDPFNDLDKTDELNGDFGLSGLTFR